MTTGRRPRQTRASDQATLNQRWLQARFQGLHDALMGRPGPAEPAPADELPRGFEPALQRVASRFGLSPFEADTLLLAAGFELSQPLRAALQGRRPSLALALGLLPDGHWDALSPQAPLRRWPLLQPEAAPDLPLAEQGLRIEERVLHALTEVAATDPRLEGRLQPVPAAPGPRASRQTQELRRVVAQLRAAGRVDAPPWLAPAPDWALAAAVLHAQGKALLLLRAQDLPLDPSERHTLARAWAREARLSGGVLGLALPEDGDSEATRMALAWLPLVEGPVLLRGPVPRGWWAGPHLHRLLDLAWPQPGPWVAASGAAAPVSPPTATTTTTATAPSRQPALPAWRAAEASAAGLAALERLAGLCRVLTPSARLDDLVLPLTQTQQLQQIVRHLRQRQRVLHDWGFGQGSTRGLGLCALFTGESGTGKTLAAEAIAEAAGQRLCAIDLAQLVSKYIGETEKNLARVFDAAEASGAVLLFDEADALFGKRSEVRDSHDRYANLEVSYLLQRIEAYQGLAVLTTNLRSALDRAFLRRIQFVVQFPFPDAPARARLWQRQWPEAAPVAELDTQALARLSLSGGHIRAAALNAAYEAAEANGPITQAQVLAAAHAELAKLERPTGATR